MKKVLYYTALGLVAGAVSAQAAPFNGGYLGINGGYGHTAIKSKTKDFQKTRDSKDGKVKSAKNIDHGLLGIHAGYAKTLPSNFFMAGELGVDFLGGKEDVKIENTSATFNRSLNYKVKRGLSFNATAKAGYNFGSVVPYISLSLFETKFEQRFNYKVSGAGITSRSVNKKKNAFHTGFAPGVGAEFLLGSKESGNKVTLGLDYKYIMYNSKKLTDVTFSEENNAKKVIGMKPTSHDLRVRLSYYL